ncbi:MAG: hypothetical protein GY851_13350 [bacterium]|nr:hypothetical protein [bacterium]
MTVTILSSMMLAHFAAQDLPPFPRVQVIPMPDRQFAFEVDGAETARYHYDDAYHRPFVFPLIGPAGRPVTRLTHPHDPDGHGHHLSIWVSHRDVNGANFWENGDARIVHEAVETIEDGVASGALTVRNVWRNGDGANLLTEHRTMRLWPLPDGESYLDVTLELKPVDGDVTFGETSFGLFAVRVAKTMSVNDGGGTLRNSEGGVGEEAIFWKPARWVDYTGWVTPDTENGITLFDHPDNPSFPTPYHVRRDGWMGASFSKEAARTVKADEKLVLRCRLYVHDGDATPETIDQQWQQWAKGE